MSEIHIVTLGTSHGDSTPTRFNSSTLLEIGDSLFLVDAGAPVNALMTMKGYSHKKLRAVFVSHTHDDHIGGVPGLVKSITKRGAEHPPVTFFFPEAGVDTALRAWLSVQHREWDNGSVAFEVIRPGVFYRNDDFQVTALPTKHLLDGGLSYGFQFDLKSGKRIVFTNDLRHDFSDFPDVIRREPTDLCFCEATHIRMPIAIPELAKCPIRRLAFIHIYDTWHGDGERKLLDLCKNLPFPVTVMHDGDELFL
jgi:ribonuclease BN (tRNA processing enzyme)